VNADALATSGVRIRVQKARKPGSGRPMWLVLGDDCLPIGPIDEFLTFLDVTGSSPNTIRAYAHHLKLYWEYLTGVGVDWRAATTRDVVNFVAWLRWGAPIGLAIGTIGERRKSSTINAIVAAATAFRVYHVRAGTMAGQIEYQLRMEPGRPYKPFLHHIAKGGPIHVRIVKIKTHPPQPRTLTDNDVKRIAGACKHLRGRFLIRLLTETGCASARHSGCATRISEAGTTRFGSYHATTTPTKHARSAVRESHCESTSTPA